VEARRTPAAVPGARVVLSVRPERVSVATEGGGNGLPATFVEAIYHGDHSRMILDVAGNPEFTVKLPLDFPLDGIEPGGALRVEFPRDHCRALAPHR
jgi:putative spermidine/putrescine transport system ATP-binding protein